MPRIYVACLASYNSGVLHGTWIDLDGKDADDVQQEINAMLRESQFPNVTCDCPECNYDGAPPALVGHDAEGDVDGRDDTCPTCKGSGQVPTAEEWAIHDAEDIPDSFGENPSLESVVKYAEAFEEHGEPFKVWWENESNQDFDVDRFQEQYQGTYRSLEDYAEQWADDVGLLSEVPENLRYYFDFEKFGRDCELGGDIWTAPGGDGIYVFDNH